ncbi:ulp1 protease family protein [Niveomyces insectorum RCEF 264]|uniref:Ulp1 protease family protein n=1 Tax=Niveomyces insectorum RCEF 264 TaxID=1081102 RepID=A0A167SJJ6_9HYPO|nr:ulp1 protease family protein [Niveomyces insectorum RCEF 264]
MAINAWLSFARQRFFALGAWTRRDGASRNTDHDQIETDEQTNRDIALGADERNGADKSDESDEAGGADGIQATRSRTRTPPPSTPARRKGEPPEPEGQTNGDAASPAASRANTTATTTVETSERLAWLRATTAAMRPEALKELFRNGVSFLSERLLHGKVSQQTSTTATATTTTDERTVNQSQLVVDRIKPPPVASSDYYTATPAAFYHPDYNFPWRDDPRDYITPAGFEAVASLLVAWKDDIEAGNVARCPYPDPIVRRFTNDNGDTTSSATDHTETRLSAVVHNFMLARSGPGHNTEQTWQAAVAAFLRLLKDTERWIAVFYAPDLLASIQLHDAVPYEDLCGLAQQEFVDDTEDGAGALAYGSSRSSSDAPCGLCAVGDFLAFAILETDQWGHPGMQLVQTALMKMLVDLDAVHRQLPVLSFVRMERARRPPGYLFDEDSVVESVTAETLWDIWWYGDAVAAAAAAGAAAKREHAQPRKTHPLHQRVCRVYGAAAGSVSAADAARRARILSAAAASIKAARWSTDGRRRSLLVAPSRPLLYERYRRTSDVHMSASVPTHRNHGTVERSAIRPYPIPAKRKARAVTPDPRLFKRGRFDRDDKRTELQRAKMAAAREAEAAAAAASIPLPPSPAATELSSDEEAAAAAGVEDVVDVLVQQQRRLPWTVIFPEEEEEEGDDAYGDNDGMRTVRRLRISAAKAEELRLLAEHKRATQEAARLKREAELRRKEEERLRKEEDERRKSAGLRPPARQVIGALSAAWHPSKDVAKSPEGTALKSKDFRTVVPKSEWLNDEIVNGFLLHLANYVNGRAGITNPKTQTPRCHAFTSFFWKALSTKGAAGTERWMKRVGVTRANFLQIETLFVPICEHSHWTLVVVRPQRATVTHMDSLGSRGAGRRAVTDVVLRWVRDVLQERYVEGAWRVQHYDSPRQTNGWDCGVHTVTNALFVALGLDPSFYGAVEMPLQRDRIAATLLNGGFSGDLDLAGL